MVKNDPRPRNTLVDFFCFEDNKVNLGSGAWIVILWILLDYRNSTNNSLEDRFLFLQAFTRKGSLKKLTRFSTEIIFKGDKNEK